MVADGYHARVDGLTSLAVLAGAIGVWIGHPQIDALVGIFITVAILAIVWQSGKAVFSGLVDGTEPDALDTKSEWLRTKQKEFWRSHRYGLGGWVTGFMLRSTYLWIPISQ